MSSAISITQSMRIARTERLDRIAFIRPPLVGQRPQDGASQSSAMKRLQPIGSRAHLLPESSHTPLYPSPATEGTAPGTCLVSIRTRHRATTGHRECAAQVRGQPGGVSQTRSEEHTSELQSLMRISYAVFCLKKKK